MGSKDIFTTTPEFCPNCGSILPLLRESGNVICYACDRQFPAHEFEKAEIRYTIHFNSLEAYAKNVKEENRKDKSQAADGPTVDRVCPQCGNDTMSYATLQLRSADEGQTVFYTCTKCKYKENENS